MTAVPRSLWHEHASAHVPPLSWARVPAKVDRNTRATEKVTGTLSDYEVRITFLERVKG